MMRPKYRLDDYEVEHVALAANGLVCVLERDDARGAIAILEFEQQVDVEHVAGYGPVIRQHTVHMEYEFGRQLVWGRKVQLQLYEHGDLTQAWTPARTSLGAPMGKPFFEFTMPPRCSWIKSRQTPSGTGFNLLGLVGHAIVLEEPESGKMIACGVV